MNLSDINKLLRSDNAKDQIYSGDFYEVLRIAKSALIAKAKAKKRGEAFRKRKLKGVGK